MHQCTMIGWGKQSRMPAFCQVDIFVCLSDKNGQFCVHDHAKSGLLGLGPFWPSDWRGFSVQIGGLVIK